MAEYIEIQHEGFRWRTLFSSKEKRLFYLYKGKIHIKPPGEHRPGLFSLIKSIGYVSLFPKAIEVKIPELLTRDGIPMEAEISAQISVYDDESALKKVILDEKEQELLTKTAIASLCRTECLKSDYIDIHTVLPQLIELVIVKLVEDRKASRIAHEVQSLSVLKFRSHDNELSKTTLEKAKAIHNAQQEISKLKHEQDKTRLQTERDMLEAEAKAQLEHLRLESELAIQRAKAEAEIARLQMELAIKEEAARIFKLPGGETVLFPKESFELEKERVRALASAHKSLEKFHEFLMKYAVQGAEIKGQLEMFRAAFEKQYGISITSPLDSLPELSQQQDSADVAADGSKPGSQAENDAMDSADSDENDSTTT